MGTGQMLITIAAIILLGSVILTTNTGIVNSNTVLMQTNFGIEAVSLAASTIDEAEDLPFDDSTANIVSGDSVQYFDINATTRLTPPAKLGCEGGGDDTLPDDFDDYNGPPGGPYRQDTVLMGTGLYARRTKVCYVTQSNLQGVSAAATWYKRLDVQVWNTVDSNDVVSMSAIYSYWYFR